ncbi:MAG: hypothetical protein L3J22_00925 [Xanthomonadales bacterium]|nr:hypothetical protein [Xanthomonadales bacterium]
MNIRKTLIASAVTLVLASTSSVMAEKVPFDKQPPIETMPLIETAPSGFFVGAPIVNNMTVMIVRVYNSQGELVLNTRSKGEPVELFAANLPDGEYSYEIKTILKLDMPTGQGADSIDEVSSRDAGSFIINGSSLFEESMRDSDQLLEMQEEASVLERIIDQAGFLAGTALNILIPAAHAQNITIDSSSPTLTFDDTGDVGTEWQITGDGASFNDFRILDRIGTNSHQVIDINSAPGSNSSLNSLVVDSDGDIHMGGGSLYLDDSSATMSLGWDSTSADFSISDTTPDIRFHDETDTAEAEMELNGGFFRLWARTTDVATWTIPFAAHVDAPSNSILISSSGAVTVAGGINDLGTIFTVGNSTTSRTQMSFVDADGSMEIEYGQGLGNVLEFERAGGAIVRFDMDAPSSSISLDGQGWVGFGTNSPDSQIDISNSGPAFRLTNTGPGAGIWEVFVNPNTGRFNLANRQAGANVVPFKFDDGAGNNLLRIGISGTNGLASRTVSIGGASVGEAAVLDVRGSIMVDGSVIHADFVFEPDYELMSIKENANFMWQNKHLPSLPKAPKGLRGPVNLVGHQMGILEELEKAHIYIEQLHKNSEALVNGHRELLSAFHQQQVQLDDLKLQKEELAGLKQLVSQLVNQSSFGQLQTVFTK